MIDATQLLAPDDGRLACSIRLIDLAGYAGWLDGLTSRDRLVVEAQGLEGKEFASAILPGDGEDEWSVICVTANTQSLGTWSLAALAETLPAGSYRVVGAKPGKALHGWLAAQYAFRRYKRDTEPGPRVLLTEDDDAAREAARMANATFRLRDRINTGANDMGPADLEAIVRNLANAYKAELTVTAGERLEREFSMIWAVGQAAGAGREPRLIELVWGQETHPRLAIVGKGVCFDTGGLNIKHGPGMLTMKTDMGGAAHAIALAELVMEHQLPVRLHLLVPAVENAISGNATRPGDVMISRKGLSVENTNTDAEGRLILADALTKAAEDHPELVIDFATLTGAARVALGPDLQALMTNDDSLATELAAAGESETDPIWRLPLWPPYKDMLKSNVADLVNAPESPFGGAIAAGLFLKEFAPERSAWAHLDIYSWNSSAKPGRPKGAEAVGLRATWQVLRNRYAKPAASTKPPLAQ